MRTLLTLAAILAAPTSPALAEAPPLGAGTSQDAPAFRLAMDNRFRNATKADFKKMLADRRVPVSEWTDAINASGVEFICLGERHDNKFRSRIADQLLSKLDFDALMIEANPVETEALAEEVARGTERVDHLGADFAPILRASLRRNPDLRIVGIEETREQELARRGKPEFERDSSIAENLADAYRGGERQVALYGALHCGSNSVSLSFQRPFYHHISTIVDDAKRINALVVVDGDWNNKFSVYMNMLELADRSFVIPDTAAVDPALYNFNWDLKQYFDNYEAIVFLTAGGS
jgi:hypothetical protein